MSDDRRAASAAERRPATARLPALKRRGCNVLVSGAVSEATLTRATRRLFGAVDLDRTRVLVQTDPVRRAREFLPAALGPDSPSVVVFELDAYERAADPLAALRADVVSAADDFAARSSHPVGGEFRLSVTSLDRLLTAYDAPAVDDFLRRTTEAVAAVRGMGHYCSDGQRSALAALSADRLFDGVVELRDRSGAEHRLRLPRSPPTAWVDL
jgi:hypothetical protein